MTEQQLRKGDISEKNITRVAFSMVLRRKQAFQDYAVMAVQHGPRRLMDVPLNHLVEAAYDSLLLAILERSLLAKDGFERTVRGYRLALVQEAMQPDKSVSTEQFELVCALANYFFTTEYLPDMEEEEAEWQKQLIEECEAMLASAHTLIMEQAYRFALLACYQPIDTLQHSDRLKALANTPGRKEFDFLVEETCTCLLKEKALAVTVPSFSATEDDVSVKVREQYEENPYPRWRYPNMRSNISRDPVTLVQKFFPQVRNMKLLKPQHTEILIAGCGTGKQSIDNALQYSDVTICNIDLSKRSIAYAMMKAKEVGVDKKMEFKQGDILEVDRLGKIFDFIECCGVLHHMKDPMAGWQKLTDCLKPGGLMRIALYSKLARTAITEARAKIAADGYTDSIEDIRAFRTVARQIQDLYFCNSPDFFTTSACRDLLFHRQEHQFTIPMIQEALKTLRLEFLGMDLTSEQHLQYFKLFPNDTNGQKLEHWDIMEHENPRLFSGMYSFWCYKPMK